MFVFVVVEEVTEERNVAVGEPQLSQATVKSRHGDGCITTAGEREGRDRRDTMYQRSKLFLGDGVVAAAIH